MKCSRNSDERGGRSQRIAAVMPRVRLDRGALDLSAEAIDVTKEDFFNDDNDDENGEREWCRSVMGRQNFANAFDREASRGCEHAERDDDRGDRFGFAVTVRMGFVRRSSRPRLIRPKSRSSRRYRVPTRFHRRSARKRCR